MRALNAIELFLVLMSLFFQSRRTQREKEREGERKRRTRKKKKKKREIERDAREKKTRKDAFKRDSSREHRQKTLSLQSPPGKNFTSSSSFFVTNKDAHLERIN